jgi:hypothetical protein
MKTCFLRPLCWRRWTFLWNVFNSKNIIPGYLYRFNKNNTAVYESICEPQIRNRCQWTGILIFLCRKGSDCKSWFNGMGKTCPLVLFIGHGSHSANNPFGSSLDCGACAASPGRHNARMLAKIANIPEVRQALKENHNIGIPASTIFLRRTQYHYRWDTAFRLRDSRLS